MRGLFASPLPTWMRWLLQLLVVLLLLLIHDRHGAVVVISSALGLPIAA
jgi:hypothetical protein